MVDFEKMTFAECERFLSCSRKRSFASKFYADRYAEAQFEKDGVKLYSYKCRFCEDGYHLSKQNRS